MHAQSEADVLQLAFFMLIKLSSDDRFPIRKGLRSPTLPQSRMISVSGERNFQEKAQVQPTFCESSQRSC